MRSCLAIIFLVIPSIIQATTVVAVIDTGVSEEAKVTMCKYGHHDFTNTSLEDVNGHGTNVSGIIHNLAKDYDYCQVILKYYHKEDDTRTLPNTIRSLRAALMMNVNIINYSSTGESPSDEEKNLVLQILDAGIMIVAPSGNKRQNLNQKCNVFPACYDQRIIVVNRRNSENIGFGNIVDYTEEGTNLIGFGIEMSGTSQATAVRTGKLVQQMSRKK